jgi:hypothetical protein
VLVTSLSLLASGCSSGPSAEAKTFCRGALTVSSSAATSSASSGSTHSSTTSTVPATTLPGSGADVKAIQAGEHSGDAGLNAGAAALLKAANEHSSIAIDDALQKVADACSRLGLPATVP